MTRISLMLLLVSSVVVAQDEVLRAIDRTADRRFANPGVWKALRGRCSTDEHHAAWYRAVGRVADSRLRETLKAALSDEPKSRLEAGRARAAALAVALSGDPELLLWLVGRVPSTDMAMAIGGVGGLPKDAADRDRVLRGARVDGRVARVERFEFGIRLEEQIFLDEVFEVLSAKEGPAHEVRAATYYAAYHPAVPADGLRRAVSRHLASKDTLTASYAVKAFARKKDPQVVDAHILAATMDLPSARGPRIARLRAAGVMPPRPLLAAVTKALRETDAHIRRTALETVATWGEKVPADDRAALAAFALVMIDRDPIVDVRRAAVLALARLAPATFEQELTRFRLAGPWEVRAAAAEGLQHLRWLPLSYMSPQSPDRPVQDRVHSAAYAFRRDPDRRVRLAVLEAASAKLDQRKNPAQAEMVIDLVRPGSVFGPAGSALTESISVPSPSETDGAIRTVCAQIARKALAYERSEDGVPTINDKPVVVRDAMVRLAAPVPFDESECWRALVALAHAVATVRGKGPAYDEAVTLLGHAARTFEPSIASPARTALEGLGVTEIPARPPALGIDPTGALAQRAIVKTAKGAITLQLRPDSAPRTVASFVRLARGGYFDGILWHRVVPAFVAQAGCPNGDGWGGPGYTIRCENNALPYERGSVGMALAGKDTGGSQWFICLEPQPRLELRYTVFGKVIEGYDVLDALVQGDVILAIDIPK